jgi:hypothetical protein
LPNITLKVVRKEFPFSSKKDVYKIYKHMKSKGWVYNPKATSINRFDLKRVGEQ